MIVEKSEYLGEWIVRDQGRGFRIVAKVAELAYSDYLKRIQEERNRAVSARAEETPPPATPPRLPTMREFLELLAADEWERKDMRPQQWPVSGTIVGAAESEMQAFRAGKNREDGE